jgi:hypothetical protein
MMQSNQGIVHGKEILRLNRNTWKRTQHNEKYLCDDKPSIYGENLGDWIKWK